eukprot:Clim_evm53s202 gene=Clim_evmTU53s202
MAGSVMGDAQVANQRKCDASSESGAVGGQFTNPNIYNDTENPFVCGASALNLDDARDMAWKFAPVLHEHPAEPYHMTDIQEFLANAEIYKTTVAQNQTTTPENLWTYVDPSVLYYDDHQYRMVGPTANYGGTEPVDGEIQAPIYFTAFEQDGFWVFTYYYWFNYNGCGGETLDYITENDEYKTARFILCNLGIHEGDWETTQVVVCPDTLEVQGVTTLGHGDGEFLDCRVDGECDFADGYPADEHHINVYIALATHATYTTVGEQYYIYSPIPVLSRVLALWVTDRTSDQGPKFLPNDTNVIALPSPSSISENDPFNWIAWVGRFGGLLPTGLTEILCLNEETTAVEDCPDDEVFQDIVSMLGLDGSGTTSLQQFVIDLVPITGDTTGPTGPYAKSQAYELRADDPHPAGLDPDAACPGNVYISDEDRAALVQGQQQARDIRNREVFRDLALGFLVLLVVGLVISVLTVLPADETSIVNLVLRDVANVDAEFPNQNMADRHWLTLWYTQGRLHVLWVVTIIFFECFGIAVIIPGIIDITELGEDLVDSNVWEFIRKFFIVLLPILGFLDLLAIMLVFYSTFYWIRTAKRIDASYNIRVWEVLYSIMAFSQLFAMFLSIMLFGLATLAFVNQKLFVEGCKGLTDATGIEGVCLDLSVFGLNSFTCGSAVINFCADVADTRTELIFYGALFLTLSHLMVVIMVTIGVRVFRLMNEFAQALNEHRMSILDNETEAGRPSTRKSSGGNGTVLPLSEDIEGRVSTASEAKEPMVSPRAMGHEAADTGSSLDGSPDH